MAIDPNLTNMTSGFNRSVLNTNFQEIDSALQDALSRTGVEPNTMEADFDMNGNDILNVGNLFIGGVPVVPSDGVDVDPDALLPLGGTDGQVLTKQSATDYDVEWEDPAVALPAGGTDGQVLTKQSSTDFDADWEDIPDAATITNVDSRTALKALDTTTYQAVILDEDARSGTFVWRLGNYSTQITADTAEGIYIKATAIASTVGAWVRVYSGPISVNWFGADPTGVADSSTAFQVAANFGGDILIPASPYRLNTVISVTLSKTRFLGSGRGSSILTTYSTGHGFSVASGLSYIEFRDFRLLRNGVPSSNAQNGIHFVGLTERARIQNVDSEGHWNNFRLCATSLSFTDHLFSDNAYDHGIYVTNEDLVAAGIQWEQSEPFVQRSNGWGIKYYTNVVGTANVAPLIVPWLYANKLGGMLFSGQATKVMNGVRILGGFSGEEGGDSIYVDTYGTVDVQIDGVQTEINGTSVCGVNGSTAATNAGRGITVTTNNTQLFITGCTALGHSHSGMVLSCPRIVVTGCTVRNNGAANVGGERTGIHIPAGRATVVGNSSLGHNAAGGGFGMYFTTDAGHTVVGNDVSESNTTPIGAAVPLTNSILDDNYGSTYEQSTTAPTPTAGTGTFTSASATLKYKKSGKMVEFTSTVIITTNGTAATYVSIPLPFANEARAVCCNAFDETGVLGLTGYIASSASAVRIYTNTGTYPGANGKTLMVSGRYWVA